MIEDATHLATLDAHIQEIHDLIVAYNRQTSGKTDKHELIEIRLKFIAHLSEHLRQQSRALRHMRGEAVEPEVHYGEAVMIGVFGGGM